MFPRLIPALVWMGLLVAPLVARTQAPTADSALSERQDRVLHGVARDRFGGRWTDLTPAQLGELRRRADAYVEQINRWHLAGGLVTSVRFADSQDDRIVSYEDLDQSAIQTGFLLGAQAHRFVVMREARSLTDISNLLSGVERLLRTGPKPGFIPCFVGPADDPAYRPIYSTYGGADPDRPGFGRLAFSSKDTNGTPVVWLGGTTRESYAALNFGLGLVHRLTRETAIRDRCARAVGLILDRLEADGWRIDDGQGRMTFVPPLLKAALLASGAQTDPRRHGTAYQASLRELIAQGGTTVVRYSDYAPNVSAFASYFLLAKLENDQGKRLQIQQQLTQLWREGEPDLNPLFAASYVSPFDPTPNSPGARAILQGMLYSYPEPPRREQAGTNRISNFTPLTANGREWSRYALLLREQAVAPFQWTHSPYSLPAPGDPKVVHPGVDLLVAYWMSREAGVLPNENAAVPTSGTRRRRGATNDTSLTNLPTAPITAPKVTP